jgi:NAD(P)-dependent dehydrogenase (short-subunit alcohol dehydrogenase family)
VNIPQTKDLIDFSGQVILVTGSGRNIGAGIARRFAQAGARVVVNYNHSRSEAEALVKQLQREELVAFAIQADVSRREAVERLISDSIAHFGNLDIVINNAGIYPLASILDMTDEQWDTVLDANLRSVFLCTQLAARWWVEQGRGGAVVNVSSIEAENPAPLHSHYVAAKSAVTMFTQATALELGPYQIRVNSISPGLIWREGLDQEWPEGVERYQKVVPLGRLGRFEDVADACMFLASNGARWITGANLRVDGGVMTTQIY